MPRIKLTDTIDSRLLHVGNENSLQQSCDFVVQRMSKRISLVDAPLIKLYVQKIMIEVRMSS